MRVVPSGMHRVDGNLGTDRRQEQFAGRAVAVDPRDRFEGNRMMHHHEVSSLVDGFLQRCLGEGKARHDAPDFIVAIAREQAHVVPVFRKRERGELFDDVDYRLQRDSIRHG